MKKTGIRGRNRCKSISGGVGRERGILREKRRGQGKGKAEEMSRDDETGVIHNEEHEEKL